MTERKNATEILLDGTWNGYGFFDGPGKFSLFIVELSLNEVLGRILNVNHIACQALVYSREELLAMNYHELLPAGSKYVLTG